MDVLLSRAGTRFLVVTLMPNLVFATYVGFLLTAGAPERDPHLATAIHVLDRTTWPELVLGVFLVAGIAVALHPVQYPLIQILEGYWVPLPFGRAASDWATERYRQQWRELRRIEREADATDPASFKAASAARAELEWLPDDDVKLLPTSLGNTLRAGEERAAARYGLDITILLPRIFSIMRPELRAQLNDRRNQLDAAARFCAMGLLACLVSIVLLVPRGNWLYLPIVTLGMAWVFYRAAVAAAKGYCLDMAAAVDLHHRDFWRALELPTPPDLNDERQRGELVCRFLEGSDLDPEQLMEIEWRDPPPTTAA